MLLVIDAGNTRIKWGQVHEDGRLVATQAATYAKLADSKLAESVAAVDKVLVANVAGEAVEAQIRSLLPASLDISFVQPQVAACDVVNQYADIEALGADRWVSAIAAWHLNKQPTIVINAGTAITIDAIARDNKTKQGVYLGGSIMPGLQLMRRALAENTAQLTTSAIGEYTAFPKNTADAIESGCINAIVGAVVLQLKLLEKHSAFLPKIVVSGGDAVKITEALNPQLKRVKIVENLVLEGLAIIEKEGI